MPSLPSRPRTRQAEPVVADEAALVPAPREWRPMLLEVGLLASLYVLYRIGRLLSSERIELAFDNALSVYHVQQWLRLPDEAVLQAWLMAWPELIKFANQYYVGIHFPATLAFLAWGYLRRPQAESGGRGRCSSRSPGWRSCSTC